MTRETPVEQGFRRFGGEVFWLLQGQWDRRVEEFEGSTLGGGGYGEQVEAGLVVAGDVSPVPLVPLVPEAESPAVDAAA